MGAPKINWNQFIHTTNKNGVFIKGLVNPNTPVKRDSKVICICPECNKDYETCIRYAVENAIRCKTCANKNNGKKRQWDYTVWFGKEINSWLILCWADETKTKIKDYVIAQCTMCGQFYYVILDEILKERSTKCIKCMGKIQQITKQKPLPVGYKCNYLEVIEPGEPFITTKGGIETTSVCKCLRCGKISTYKNSILRLQEQLSCGCLKSWLEQQTAYWLDKYDIPHLHEKVYDKNLRAPGGKGLRFDFIILKQNNNDKSIFNTVCLIECQGEQHRPDCTKEFGTQQRETDVIKKEYCERNNIKLFEIWYDENVKERVKQILEEVKLLC